MADKTQTLIIKTSPLIFLKRLIVIEFAIALLTTLLALSFDLNQVYTDLQLARVASFSIIATILVTTVQVLIITAAFTTWYFESYQVDTERIRHWQALFFGGKDIALTQHLTDIRVKQSWLGQKFNYGNLLLLGLKGEPEGRLKNIPNPAQQVKQILQLITPQQIDAYAQLNRPIPALIAEGEGQYIEFKSSFSWDYRRQSINRDLNKAVMKNVVGFMNTTGGVILLGVDDEGQVLGLETEFQAQGKPNADGFENSLNTAFRNMVGTEYRQYLQVDFAELEEKTVCRLLVLPTPEPVYLHLKNSEEFYIRTGNSSQPLNISQAVKYIQHHFES